MAGNTCCKISGNGHLSPSGEAAFPNVLGVSVDGHGTTAEYVNDIRPELEFQSRLVKCVE